MESAVSPIAMFYDDHHHGSQCSQARPRQGSSAWSACSASECRGQENAEPQSEDLPEGIGIQAPGDIFRFLRLGIISDVPQLPL